MNRINGITRWPNFGGLINPDREHGELFKTVVGDGLDTQTDNGQAARKGPPTDTTSAGVQLFIGQRSEPPRRRRTTKRVNDSDTERNLIKSRDTRELSLVTIYAFGGGGVLPGSRVSHLRSHNSRKCSPQQLRSHKGQNPNINLHTSPSLLANSIH